MTTLSPELMDEITLFVNKAFLLIAGRKEIPRQEDDDIYRNIRTLKFPVKVLVMAGQPAKGLQNVENVFSFQMAEATQAPSPMAWGVAAIVAFAGAKKLDISVAVYGSDQKGFSFAPGAGFDDVDITPTVELFTGNYPTEKRQ